MSVRIAAVFCAAIVLLAFNGGASAAVWAWGCQGQLGAQQVIFNRYSMFVVESRKPLPSLRKLTDEKINGLIKGESVSYDPQNGNDGFTKTIEFINRANPDRKLVMTEQSSRKLSSRSRLVCGRDESTDTYRKVYRLQRDNEPPRDITMQCIEYQLSTRGGRSCD